jgi:hypothetical protein
VKTKPTKAERRTITDAVYCAIVDLKGGTDAQLISNASRRHGKKITRAQLRRAIAACSRRGLDRGRWSSQTSQPDSESSLVARCLQGDIDALTELVEKYHGPLLEFMLSSWRMDRTKAEDMLADLWGDCVPGNADRPSILEKFSGGSLQSWLSFMVIRNVRLR